MSDKPVQQGLDGATGSLSNSIENGDLLAASNEASADKSQSYWGLVRRQFKKNKPAVAAFLFICLLVLVGLFADFLANDKPIACKYNGTLYFPVLKQYVVDLGIASWPAELTNADWKNLEYEWSIFPPVPYRANETDNQNPLITPFADGDHSHYLGTDQLGRDMLAGLIHGTRISLAVGLVAMGIATLIGVILGALAGFFGGWVDMVISRVIEIFLNFPVLLLIITIVAFLGANIFYMMMVIGLTGWMGIARLMRGEVLRVRNMEYVTAADALGFNPSRVILRHVIPNSLAPVLVSIAFGVASAILIEASLSFIGVGVPATVITWGSTLNAGLSAVYAWWLTIFPGFMIFLTVLSYNLVGDGLRDATDPRLKI
ncbi:MAG: ABC transporter permease [Candidatus Kapaibacterium sp.]